MKWFKHDTDASADAKLKKLIIRYGAEGYAVYFHCLELIAGNISENNITFELEHDAEIIADNLKIKGTPDRSSIDIVNDIMLYIVELDLLSQSGGRIFCFKLLKRLDASMTSSAKFRSLITKAKESHDKVMISHDNVMQDKTRLDYTRLEETRKEEKIKDKEKLKKDLHYFDIWFNVYNKKVAKKKALSLWLKLKDKDKGKCLSVVDNYVLSTPDNQFRKNPDTYLRNECWNDEIVIPKKLKSEYKELCQHQYNEYGKCIKCGEKQSQEYTL